MFNALTLRPIGVRSSETKLLSNTKFRLSGCKELDWLTVTALV